MTLPLYRVFSRTLIVFFALILIFGAQNAVSAPNTTDTYQVKGILVDVSGSSALDARNKAFIEARRKAYQQVAARLAPGKDAAVPDDKTIASAVHDFEIVSEKMTSRRYAGTVDVRFTPAAIKRVVAAAGTIAGVPMETPAPSGETIITGSETSEAPAKSGDDYVYSPRETKPASAPVAATASSNTILVLPWYGVTGRQTLWGQGNPWRAAWEENRGLSKDKSMPVVLPVGDVEDVRAYSPPQPMSRRGDIDGLMKRYNAGTVVLAMAEPQDNGNVMVSLYRYVDGAPVPITRFGIDTTFRDILGEAVIKSASALRDLPVANAATTTTTTTQVSMAPGIISTQPQTQAQAMGTYRTLARFSGLQEWVAMRQALARIPGMGAISVHSISPSQANLEFDYRGDVNSLSQRMAQNGLQISMLPTGEAMSSGPGDVQPQFMISSGRVY